MGGTCTIEGGTITGGIATQGGGVYVGPDGILSVVGGTLGSNNADFGAGIYNAGGEVTLSGGVVSDNSASFDGGGVYADGGGVSLADGAVLEKNRASESGGNLALGGDSNGVVFMDGGAINVQGELVMSGGTITGNGAVIGSGICFDCEQWQKGKGRLAVSGSPLITENYLSWAAHDREDLTIFMGNDTDELARISVEGSFTPVKPPLVNKHYRGGWEYIALVDPGDYEMDAFACGQDRDIGHTDYVLVKHDDVLYAYHHTHTWETHTDARYPNRVTLTCTHATCPNS